MLSKKSVIIPFTREIMSKHYREPIEHTCPDIDKLIKGQNEIIYEHSCDAGCTWNLEKEHHNKYKLFHYKPQIYFKGITESFSLKLPVEEIISYLEQL